MTTTSNTAIDVTEEVRRRQSRVYDMSVAEIRAEAPPVLTKSPLFTGAEKMRRIYAIYCTIRDYTHNTLSDVEYYTLAMKQYEAEERQRRSDGDDVKFDEETRKLFSDVTDALQAWRKERREQMTSLADIQLRFARAQAELGGVLDQTFEALMEARDDGTR